MVNVCSVVGCNSNSKRVKISFFRFPSVGTEQNLINDIRIRRRNLWVERLRRADVTTSNVKYRRICANHFVGGIPAGLMDVDNVDWAPSLNMGYDLEKSIRRENKAKLKTLLNPVDVTLEHSYTEKGPLFDLNNSDEDSSPANIDIEETKPTPLSFRDYIKLLNRFTPQSNNSIKITSRKRNGNKENFTRKRLREFSDDDESESDFESAVLNEHSQGNESPVLQDVDNLTNMSHSELISEFCKLKLELESTKEELGRCKALLSSIVKDEKGLSVVLLKVNS